MVKFVHITILAIIILFFFISNLSAAMTAKFRAEVFSDAGNPIKDAVISIVYTRGGQPRTFTTNKKGKIFSPFIDVGEYDLTVEKAGLYVSQFTLKVRNRNAEIEMDETRNLGPNDTIPTIRFQADRVLYLRLILSKAIVMQTPQEDEFESVSAPRKLMNLLEEVKGLYQTQKYDEALKVINDKIDKFENESSIYYLKGIVLYKLENLNEAIIALQKSLELDPNQTDSNYYLGKIYEDKGNNALAIGYFENELKVNPGNTAILAELSLLYKDQEKYDKAIRCLEKFIEINPNEINIHLELAELHQMAGNANKSKEILSKLEKDGVLDPKVIYNQGVAYWNSNDYNLALEAFKKAVLIDPTLTMAFKQMGYCYVKLNEPKEAIAQLKKYLKLEPEAEDNSELNDLINKLEQATK